MENSLSCRDCFSDSAFLIHFIPLNALQYTAKHLFIILYLLQPSFAIYNMSNIICIFSFHFLFPAFVFHPSTKESICLICKNMKKHSLTYQHNKLCKYIKRECPRIPLQQSLRNSCWYTATF